MKKDDLLKLGLTDESVIEQIIILHGKDIEKHKQGLATTQAELTNVQSQLTEAQQMVAGFQGLDIEAIKKSATDWQVKAEQAQAESAKQIAQIKFDHAMENALRGAKAKNAKAVRALLDESGLKIKEDGSIDGLSDQLDKVRAENDYLFESDKVTPKIVSGGTGKSTTNDVLVSAARKAAGLE